MNRISKTLLFSVLLGLTVPTIASPLPHQCPEASSFYHKKPGSPWIAIPNETGWQFDQSSSENSTLQTIPGSANSYVLIAPGGNGTVQCTYGYDLLDKGISTFDLIRRSAISKKEIPPQFTPYKSVPEMYICHFSAGNSSVCAWN